MKEEELAKELAAASRTGFLFHKLAHYLAPLITAQEEKASEPMQQWKDLTAQKFREERDEALARVAELEKEAQQWKQRASHMRTCMTAIVAAGQKAIGVE